MGESGAGKTTLLNILTQRNTKDLKMSGQILVNGESVNGEKMMRMSAYVQQADLFCGNLTVREHLSFSAHLRMNARYTYEQREERVERVLEEMGLVDCQHTKISIRFGKSLSMGEMKRLSFASESLTEPSIFFCDEPTSGLDAFMAHQVVNVLRKLAARGKTIVMTIHQPSSQVYDMFDKLCLMSLGKIAYLGPANEVTDLFKKAGYPLPPFTNPADHVIHTLATSEVREEQGIKINIKVRETFEASPMAKKLSERISASISERSMKGNDSLKAQSYFAAPWLRQLFYCTKRSFLSTLRDPLLLQVRLIQIIITSMVIGFVNFQTELRRRTVVNLNGVLYVAVRDMLFMFLMPCVHVFTSELPVFLRESHANIYRTDAYFLGKNLAELPQYIALPIIYTTTVNYLVGLHSTFGRFALFVLISTAMANVATSIGYASACIFGSMQTASAYTPMAVLTLMVFGGYFVRINILPWYFKPFPTISFFKYAFEAVMINKWSVEKNTFIGCEAPNAKEFCVDGVNGTHALTKFDFGPGEHLIPINITILVGFMIFFRAIGIFALILPMAFQIPHKDFKATLPLLRVFPDLLSVYATVKLWIDGVSDECNVELFGFPRENPTVWTALKDNNFGKPFVLVQTTTHNKTVLGEAVPALFDLLGDFLDSTNAFEVVASNNIMDLVRVWVAQRGSHPHCCLDEPCTLFYMDMERSERLLKEALPLPEGFDYVALDGERHATACVAELLYASPDDVNLARSRIEKMPSVGVRHIPSGEIASFEYNDGFGFITHHYTYPPYRRLGLGRLVELKLSQLNFEKLGIWPYKGVSRNRPRVIEMSESSLWWQTFRDVNGAPALIYYTVFTKDRKPMIQIHEN
ncbi:hypothetical protein QR680_018390 [Steinernema hermaphroditum]|uniref:ABC transporter domain-containing protein n=1 Tax=Steinernema hermaphroditum TaxID=289476 RepID=A0AA39HK54_9BILA|nr:hypothetical protein QR680_018390 [Steinernema hermaphroditum]